MHIDRKTRQELIDALTPHVQSTGDRQALLGAVFYGSTLIDLIPLDGAPRNFASRLIIESLNYGEIEPGEPAILPVLHEIKMRVGGNKAAQIDALIAQIEHSPRDQRDRDNPDNRVFISYRRTVSTYMGRAVFQDLRAAGYDVFFDVEGMDSGDFEQIILRQIEARPHFVVILAPGSLDRCTNPGDWLRREIEHALDTERNIVPLMFNGFRFDDYAHILTGKLAALPRQSGIEVPGHFFSEAMDRLRRDFLRTSREIDVINAPRADESAVLRRVAVAAAEAEPTAEELEREAEMQRREQELADMQAALEQQMAEQQGNEQQLAQMWDEVQAARDEMEARRESLAEQEARNRQAAEQLRVEQQRIEAERERLRQQQAAQQREQTEQQPPTPAPSAAVEDDPPSEQAKQEPAAPEYATEREIEPPRIPAPKSSGNSQNGIFWGVGLLIALGVVVGLVSNLGPSAEPPSPTPFNFDVPTLLPSAEPPSPTPFNFDAPTLLTSEAERDEAVANARAFTGGNQNWNRVSYEFAGVEMVLVPAGCFMMGSEDGQSDERPVHEQCFDEPFWIDKYEVTNADYGSTGCEQWSSDPDQPRNCVTWLEARDHCAGRGARLPTEAQWEYAARGPDSLVYPWGNDYNAELVIGGDDPTFGGIGGSTAPVGSRPGGASWVGALDMSGNVWEWTSSLVEDYPYAPDHESNSNNNSARVRRGGSFFITASALRSAYRLDGTPTNVFISIGFRCALS